MAENYFNYAGQTSGTPVTVANSGRSVVTGSPVFTDDGAGHIGIRYSTTGATANVTDSFTATTNGLSYAALIRLHTAPSAACLAFQARNSSSSVSDFLVNTNRTLTFRDGGGATVGISTALTLDVFYILRVAWKPGSSTTTGSVQVKITTLDGATTLLNASTTTANVGTAGLAALVEGKLTGSPSIALDFFNVHWISDTYTLAIDPAPNVVPNGGPDQTGIEPYSTVTLVGQYGNGTTDTFVQSGPTPGSAIPGGVPVVTLGGSLNTRTFPAPATWSGVTLYFTYAGFDVVQVDVLDHTQFVMIGSTLTPFRFVS